MIGACGDRLDSFTSIVRLFAEKRYVFAELFAKYKSGSNALNSFFNFFFDAMQAQWTVYDRWALSCFSSRFSHNPFDIDINHILDSILAKTDASTSETVSQVLLGKKDITTLTETELKNLPFFLLLIEHSDHVLFRLLKKRFAPIVDFIGRARIVATVGVQGLSLFETMEESDFKVELPTIGLTEITDATYEPNVLQTAQTVVTKRYRYPRDSPVTDWPALMSLANTSILEEKHFFDVVAGEVKRLIEEGDLDAIPKASRASALIIPFVVASMQPFIYQDLPKYYKLISAKLPPTIVEPVQQRMCNDLALLKTLSFLTGNEVSILELEKHSLPFVLGYVIHLKEILEYVDVQFFVYSDKDISNDFDFIFCYKAMKALLELMHSKDMQGSRAQHLWEDTVTFLHSVKSVETRKKLALDMFSLIFLQQNERIVCPPFLAKKIVDLVSSVDSSIYYRFGGMALATARFDNIEKHVGLNRLNMIKAMQSKNWLDAEVLSTTNSDYRREFVIGMGISELILSGKVISDCGGYEKDFRIEAGLSTSHAKSLLGDLEEEQDPLLANVIRKRLESKDDVLAAVVTHPLCHDSVREFDRACEPFVSEGRELAAAQHHQHLCDWLESLRLFFKCSLLCNRIQQRTFNEILKFQAQKVLSGAVNSNNINLAVGIARKFGLDLFRFVLNNVEWFDITSEFTKRFQDRYPLECMTLNLTVIPAADWNGLRIPQKYQKFVAPKQKEVTEDVLFLTAVTALENPATPLEFYDDIIWRIDHAKFCEELIKRVDRISEETATALLDIVGYTMTEALEQQVATFMMKKKVFEIAQSRVESEIIHRLVEKGEIELLASYLFQYGDGEKLGDCLLSVSRQLVGDGNNLRLLLSRFPDYLEFLAKHLDEVIPDIMPLCPQRRKHRFEAFCSLPSQIRIESSLSDSESIVQAFCRHPDLICDLNPVHLCLFPNPDNFVSILKCTAEKVSFNAFIANAYVIMRLGSKNAILSSYIEEKLSSVLESISVTSNESEDRAFDDVTSIKLFCQSCELGESIMSKANAFYNFVFHRPFLRTKMPYTLSKSSVEDIMKICFMYDLDQSAVEIAAVCDYDMTRYVLNRAYIPMKLSLYSTVKSILASFEKQIGCPTFDVTKFDRYDPVFTRHDNEPKMAENDMFSMNSPFLVPFRFSPMFRPEAISLIMKYDIESLQSGGAPGELPIYSDIQFVCQKKKSNTKPQKNQNAIFFFRRFASLEAQMSLLVAFQDFNNLFPSLMAITTYEERKFALIHRMIHMGICFDVERTAEKSFTKFDPTLSVTGPLWKDLVKFCQKRHMVNLLVDVYAFMGRLEDAALASVQIFKEATNFGRKLYAIGVASVCLTDSVRYRQNPDLNSVPVFQPSDNSFEYISQMAKVVDIQKDVCNFLYRQGVTTQESIDIIHVDSAPVRVAGIVFQHTDANNKLLNQIMSEFSITFKTLFRIVADQMKDCSITELLSFVEQKKDDPNFMNDLLPELLHAVSMTHMAFNVQLILNKVKFASVADEVKHNLDYNFIENAFCLTTDHLDSPGVRDMIPLLAYRASQLGHQNIVEKCFSLC